MRSRLPRFVFPQRGPTRRGASADGARGLRTPTERAGGGAGRTAGPVFRLGETDLHEGTSLIEASAGTGKTYTIAGLFLRLILEKGLSVREILVVTYTVAAT